MGWVARQASKAVRTSGLSNATRHAVGGTIEKPFKGIITKAAPEFAREVNRGRYGRMVGTVPSTSFINPKNIVGDTVAAWQDLKAPWKGPGTFGSKLKNAASDIINNIRYKPGEVFERNGKLYQNMHKHTIGGQAINAVAMSGPGAAGLSFATGDKSKPMAKRIGSAAIDGLAISRLGMPISGPAYLGKAGFDLAAKGFKKSNPQNMNVY